MRRKRLLWQVFPVYLLFTCVTIFIVVWWNFSTLQQFHARHTREDLQHTLSLLIPAFTPLLIEMDAPKIQRACEDYGRMVNKRVTVVLPDGTVAGDSWNDPKNMKKIAYRSEIPQLRDRPYDGKNSFLDSQGNINLYHDRAISYHGDVLAVLRVSQAMLSFERPVRDTFMQVLLIGCFLAALLAITNLLVTHTVRNPLAEIIKGARQFAENNFRYKISPPEIEEFSELASTMNAMAKQLDVNISAMQRHRNEQDVILSSMTEGVFAVDMDEYLLSANNAATRMLALPPQTLGRAIQEVIRNVDLQAFVVCVLESENPIEAEIALRDGSDRYLLANGALLRDVNSAAMGAVVVLNDITRMRRLENMRREFVANVSHELRTPITSIKGFVETLQDGAFDDRVDAMRFLQVIAKQVDRLNVIIEDLLLLSTIEQSNERASIRMESTALCNVMATASQLCSQKAQERGVHVQLECPEELRLRVNPPLLEQAVVNLLDNAIKYSDTGDRVNIVVVQNDQDIIIRVADRGCGIAAEHLPRLFERFYRVDKARSRKLGGTGLGLAIVKHIAQAHGGHVAVTSTIGAGSTFEIHLPISLME